TGVAVFDKKGQFVDNLKQEDFELRVDGKLVSISFFEPAAIKNSQVKTEQNGEKTDDAINSFHKSALSGRTIIFVVDDIHLSFDSHRRTRDLINKFINQEMLPNDTVAVVSTTGKIGFLQQFTNNKTVLHAAVERLIFNRNYSSADRSNPPMSEYEAQLIDHYDPQVTDTFANLVIRESPGTKIETAREIVRSRARTILFQAEAITRGTYSTLEQVIRRSAPLPGRKIVFFVSDGFLLDAANSDSSSRLRRITDAAARTNTVIYSFDAKGLEAGFPEGTTASTTAAYRVQSGERFEAQDGLNFLADSTGGRFIHDTNDLKTELTKTIAEASTYYLLAWQPESENGKSEKLRRIEVSVRNRPELKVRVQGGYLDSSLKTADEETDKNKKTDESKKPKKNTGTILSPAEQQLSAAVNAQFIVGELPTSLVANYLDLPNDGGLLAAALQINGNAVEFMPAADKETAAVELLGVVYNSDGKREGYFRELLKIDAPVSKSNDSVRPNVYYNYQLKLKPGLYQVRVASRDAKSGHVGNANEWIEIPDLSTHRLTLSSILLGEKKKDNRLKNTAAKIDSETAGVEVKVDRRFVRSSQLRYLIFIYNAATEKTGADLPDVTLQTEILRGGEVVLTSPPHKISVEGQDAARLPYAAEIPLNTFSAGRYVLRITVNDRTAKTKTEQTVNFEVTE
ncbi:MAG: VWA domain-containing protein, partial [Pyrinomonadaceae bacterium]